MDETAKERLIKYLKRKRISQSKFEKMTGLSNGYITNLKKNPGAEMLTKILSAAPDLNGTWLLTGEGEMIVDAPPSQPIPSGIPLIPLSAMAGYLSGDNISVMDYECERYAIPIFHSADFLIRINGDSMMPKYCSGDVVACQRVPLDHLWFQWGKTYVIDTRQGALIKRIEESSVDGFLTIKSENPNYGSFDLPIEEVFGVALVLGVIRVE